MLDEQPPSPTNASAALEAAERRVQELVQDTRDRLRVVFAAAAVRAGDAIGEQIRGTLAHLAELAELTRDEPVDIPADPAVRALYGSTYAAEVVAARVGAVLAVSASLGRALELECRMFVRRLLRAEARVLDSVRVGLAATSNQLAELRIRWQLHCSEADAGRAPSPTDGDYEDNLEAPIHAELVELGILLERLTARVTDRLEATTRWFLEDVGEVAEAAVATVPIEVERARQRTDPLWMATDKALAAAVVTVASAAAAVAFQGTQTELLTAAMLGGGAAALAGAAGQVTNNARQGGPLFEGWRQAALRAFPAGLVAGLGGTVVAAPWLWDLAPRVAALLAADHSAWGVIARGLWQTGELVLSHAVARALVVGSRAGLERLRQQALTGDLFDPVLYGASVGRSTLEFALSDAREWLELQDDSYEASP